LNWEEEKPSKKAEKAMRTVVLKRMFTPAEMDRDPGLMLDLKDDVRSECSRLGEVTNVVVYDVRHYEVLQETNNVRNTLKAWQLCDFVNPSVLQRA
jgi:hypothetical protein